MMSKSEDPIHIGPEPEAYGQYVRPKHERMGVKLLDHAGAGTQIGQAPIVGSIVNLNNHVEHQVTDGIGNVRTVGRPNPQFIVKDSGAREEYASGMRRDTQEGKPDYTLLPLPFLERFAQHLTAGAKKYGRKNWELASSQEELDRFKGSAFRHFVQWLRGDVDEDHVSACCFNMAAAEHVKEKLRISECQREGESN